MKVIVIRASGAEEKHEIPAAELFQRIGALIGAKTTDTVNIFRHPEAARQFKMRQPVMVIDDNGYETEDQPPTERDGMLFINRVTTKANKPANEKATTLYHAICKPGTTHEIVGDVAIIDDQDLA